MVLVGDKRAAQILLRHPTAFSGPLQQVISVVALYCRQLPARHFTSFGRQQDDAAHLAALNRQGRQAAVVEAVQQGRVPLSEGVLGEYVKALAATNSLDGRQVMQHLHQAYASSQAASSSSHPGAPPPPASKPAYYYQQPPQGPFLPFVALPAASQAGAPAGDDKLGSLKNPVYISHAEPGFWTQVFRTLRYLGLTFVLVSAAGALLEDRSMPRNMLHNPDLKPQADTQTRLADVKGVDEAKGEVEEVVHYLKDPQKFTTLGGKLPKGVLLVGPPGTGKTMLARAIAGEAGVPFFYCSGSEFEEMYVGVGARRVRDLFAAAKKHAPCIVFIDEIDAIGGSRNPKDQVYMKMTLNQLLVELDGFKPSEGVIVIAATNFPELLDKALVRPGRFDRHITVPNPDVEGRRQILEQHFQNIPREESVDLRTIAKGTPGFSGADLANLVNIAALKAARDGSRKVSMQALEFARDRILMGAERKSAVISEENRRLTAYHEGGHALVALHTSGAHPIHKATIVPRGQALGMVTQLPDSDDETSVSRRQLLAQLDVFMGGRVAEELIFGEQDITTGASSDLQQATRIARDMVTKYGMSSRLGQLAVDLREEGAISGELKQKVESEVRELLASAYSHARQILTEHRDELDALASALIERETLSGEQIKELLS